MANFFDQFDPPTPPAPPSPPAPPQAPANFFDQFDAPARPTGRDAQREAARNRQNTPLVDVAASGADGLRQGIANMLGAPVDLVNALPMVANVIPGVEGVGPFSDRPVGGSADFDDLLRLGIPRTDMALIDDYDPQTAAGRFAERIGEEIGATAVPVGVGARLAQGAGPIGRAAMESPLGQWLQPMARQPTQVAAREGGYAVAAGAGAQAGNELQSAISGENDGEGTWWSDLLGSVGGLGALGAGSAIAGLGRTAIGGATGNTQWADDFARREVVRRVLSSSDRYNQAFTPTAPGGVDVEPLARMFESPTTAEAIIPGYRATIAERADDPGLASYVRNVTARAPGASNTRAASNRQAVEAAYDALRPEGNSSVFGDMLAQGVAERIGAAEATRAAAASAADTAGIAATPRLAPVDRGVAIRDALSSRRDAEGARVSELYGQLDSGQPVDMTGLRQGFNDLSQGLPLNDQARFLPPEAGVINRLVPEEGPAVLPLSEAQAIRSGLASDMRNPSATAQQRQVTGQFLDEYSNWLNSVLPEDQRALLDEASAARLDVGRRFEDVGAVPDILRTTGRDQYSMPPEAVPGRAMGGETDYRAVLAEVGDNAAARAAMADQLLADAAQGNALRSPEALQNFLQQRNVMFADFPEARAALEQAGVSRQALDAAETALANTRAALEGRGTPTGNYLRYDNTGTARSIENATWRSPRPEESTRELIDVAGGTPEARAAGRSAFWESLDNRSRNSERQITGNWMQRMMDDERFRRTGEILYEDVPQDWDALRQFIDAIPPDEALGTVSTLRSALGQGRRDYQAALSTASVASTMRSVNRGQLSPTIAGVGLASTWLRRRIGRLNDRAMEELEALLVDDPNAMAELLRRYNPADEAAMNQAFLDAYGARFPTLANALSQREDDE